MQAGQAGLSGSLAGPRQQRKPWVPRVRGRGFPADGERSAVSQAGVGEPRVCSCGTPGGAGYGPGTDTEEKRGIQDVKSTTIC